MANFRMTHAYTTLERIYVMDLWVESTLSWQWKGKSRTSPLTWLHEQDVYNQNGPWIEGFSNGDLVPVHGVEGRVE